MVVGRLLLLGFLHAGRQLLVLGGLRPLHAVHGAVEAFGCEAGTGLGAGSEWHVSGRSWVAVLVQGIAGLEHQWERRF